MKKLLITLTLIIFSGILNAQEKQKIEYLGYIPMRTYHFLRTDYALNSMHKTEGGNLGLILIRRKNQSEKVYTEKHLGLVRNSYGEPSIILNQGFGYRYKNFNLGMVIGIATGYEKCFEATKAGMIPNLPGVFKNNGILPTSLVNISLEKGFKISDKVNVSPLLNISPAFLNGGLVIKYF